MHTPVLAEEAIKRLDIKKGGLYIDATAGEGGHTAKILEKGGRVLAIDWDEEQIQNLTLRIKNKENVIFTIGNYADIEEIAKKHDFVPTDGVLIDLGLSMSQIAQSGRGFSYKAPEEPLDMRISKVLSTTASDLLNSLSEDELYELIARNSEEILSRPIAEGIVTARMRRKILRAGDLVQVIDTVLREKGRGEQAHKVYSRVFQALRIAVNNEFENIKKGVKGAIKIVKDGGIVVVITFHSREDRMVKQIAREMNSKSTSYQLPYGSGRSFERSAKMRVIMRSASSV